MNRYRSISLSLASAIALALLGTAPMAMAQTPPQQQAPPVDQQQGGSVHFYPGTKSSATYQIQNGTLTVHAGMPAHVQSYGPPPPFKTLDSNHNDRITQTEAKAYPPLANAFLYVSGGSKTISRARYNRWVKTQH